MISHARLAAARARVARSYTDRFAVYRETGETETDPADYTVRPVLETIHADIAGLIQTNEAQTREASIPGQQVAESGLAFHTSYDNTGILTNDIVVCLSSRDDTELPGTRVRVTAPFTKSHATARRFQVKQIS